MRTRRVRLPKRGGNSGAAIRLRFFIMKTKGNRPSPRLEIQAIGLTTRKARGEAAEAVFLAKAASFGFGVAKPWGDSERYDFIVDSGKHLWRVQLKSTGCLADSRYKVKAGGFSATYTHDEIDFLVAYIVPENLWYVVPIEGFTSGKFLHFYPHGGSKSRLEEYREAWCLMACARDEDGPSQILVQRKCQETSPLGVCALCR